MYKSLFDRIWLQLLPHDRNLSFWLKIALYQFLTYVSQIICQQVIYNRYKYRHFFLFIIGETAEIISGRLAVPVVKDAGGWWWW